MSFSTFLIMHKAQVDAHKCSQYERQKKLRVAGGVHAKQYTEF
jgi:hypothetical protein